MIKDYHMHPTVVQDHTRFADFARAAIEHGVEEVCITDHMPLSTNTAGDRIPRGRVEEYCQIVHSLAAEWEGKLSVKLGIEIDYHPDFHAEIESVLNAGDYDFVIGATHLHVGQCDIFSSVHTHNEFAEAKIKNTIACARSGYFDTIAHFDFYRWHFTLPERFPLTDDGYTYGKHIPLLEQALDVIQSEGLFLEINPHLAVIQNNIDSTYPEAGIVRMALARGMKFSYGSDAHHAEHVGANLAKLRAHPVYGPARTLGRTHENDQIHSSDSKQLPVVAGGRARAYASLRQSA